MKMAADLGRKTRPDIKLASAASTAETRPPSSSATIGLNYVSCCPSACRLPACAAQAAIKEKNVTLCFSIDQKSSVPNGAGGFLCFGKRQNQASLETPKFGVRAALGCNYLERAVADNSTSWRFSTTFC